MRILTVTENDAGQRLDKFLQKAVKGLPLSLMYKYIRLKKIKVNRARAEQSYMLQPGDTVQLFIRDEFFDGSGRDLSALASIKPKLEIVYEDDHIILCNKRPGVLVHEDEEGGENTLIQHICAYLYQKGEYDPEKEQSFAPALCNRIDRNTGGIVIAAKDAESLRCMNEKIRLDQVAKFYLCAVHGRMPRESDRLTGTLRKDSRNNIVQVSDKKLPGGKEIITEYRVLSYKNGISMLEIHLVTGRTHQIRAHMAYIGHPLVGDGKYGVNREDREKGYKYQALYAWRLRFDFEDGSGPLGYLAGREFFVPKESVWFLRDLS
ncbi:MAG: RluA family pseudouridine synthase [Clostridia bacterium]|nr:RluA family pseudouridine synthase [Clostridia bacterium]